MFEVLIAEIDVSDIGARFPQSLDKKIGQTLGVAVFTRIGAKHQHFHGVLSTMARVKKPFAISFLPTQASTAYR